MELVYFVVDQEQQLRRVPRDSVETLWNTAGRVETLGVPLGDELRLVTALLDDALLPVVCYFVRLDLREGRITSDSRTEAYEAMTARHRRRYDHPAARRQFVGWPPDWQRQLAVALDIPVQRLTKLGLGGPLLMSDLWGISLEQVLTYFEEACNE